MYFDAQYETTTYPCELLWGPGAWQDAITWLKKEQPEPDEVEILDRLFLIQHREDRLYPPRSPDVAAGLAADERQGQWHLVRADFSLDAYGRTSQVVAGGLPCSAAGPCGECAAETLGIGTWRETISLAAASGITVSPRKVRDAQVPSMRSWPRSKQILVG